MQLQFDIRYWKVVPNYARKNIFMVMTSSMTSQEDLEIVPLYSLINEKWHFFVITDITITPSVCMYHWILNMRIYLVMDYITDDVIRATNKSKLWTAIALSIFELEKRSKAQNVWNWTGYQKFISVSYTDQQILASTQSPIAISLCYLSICSTSSEVSGFSGKCILHVGTHCNTSFIQPIRSN